MAKKPKRAPAPTFQRSADDPPYFRYPEQPTDSARGAVIEGRRLVYPEPPAFAREWVAAQLNDLEVQFHRTIEHRDTRLMLYFGGQYL